MGRQEALTAMALGRSPYDEETVEAITINGQEYDDRGHVFSTLTREEEKEQTRAMNEVMQMAGVVEKKPDVDEMKEEGSWISWGVLGGLLLGWLVFR